jgi:hypothetical protein
MMMSSQLDVDFDAEFPAFFGFGCGRFYQRFSRKAITTVQLQRLVFEGG